jgi:hypothetical protein
MASKTIDERLNSMEARLVELQRLIDERLAAKPMIERRGWRAIVGKFEDVPYYEEAMRLGREWRESQHDEIDEDAR